MSNTRRNAIKIVSEMDKKHFLYKRWTKFCTDSSIHGLFHIRQSKPIWKIPWTLLLTFMIFLTTWCCVNSVVLYYRYDVKTSMQYDEVDQIQFPAITFCNQFGLLKSIVGSNLNVVMFYVMANVDDVTNMTKVYNMIQEVKL